MGVLENGVGGAVIGKDRPWSSLRSTDRHQWTRASQGEDAAGATYDVYPAENT